MKTICYVAGKSGGHLIPAFTHAEKMRTQNLANRILFFTSSTRLDISLTKNNQIIDQTIYLPFVDFPGKRIWRYPSFFILGLISFLQAVTTLRRNKTEHVISMGGSISIPVCIAAKALGISFDLYELNVEPGKAIYFLSRWANNIYVCFDKTKKYFPQRSCISTSYPIRYNEMDIQPSTSKKERKTIFILGGSQGSISLNNIVRSFIEVHPEIHETIAIIHQTGNYDKNEWKKFYHSYTIPAQVFAFKDDLVPSYNHADIIICRSGAGTLAETIFFKKPCITIPLELSSTSHQLHNAQAYAQVYPELVQVIQQKNLKENVELFSTQLIKKIS